MTLRAVASPVSAWGAYTLSANQTAGLSVNSPVRFDTVMGGNLPIAGYTITLPADGTFRLVAGVLPFFSSTGKLEFRWYDVTAGAYLGVLGYILPPTNAANNGMQPTAYAIVSTTQPTQVQLRISAVVALSSIQKSSYAEVMRIP